MPFDTSGMTAGTWQLTTMTKTITNSGNLTLGFYGTTGNGVNVWVDLVSNVSRTSANVQTLLTNTINKATRWNPACPVYSLDCRPRRCPV
jgi:hypothetical protein